MPRIPAFVGGGSWIDNDGHIVNADKVEIREFCRGEPGWLLKEDCQRVGRKIAKDQKWTGGRVSAGDPLEHEIEPCSWSSLWLVRLAPNSPWWTHKRWTLSNAKLAQHHTQP